MKKILLLTTSILLSSASIYAACNPNLPTCQCSYPEMKNGIIGCSETYCEIGTKCMSDGSCCPSDNYCESSELGKQCCSAEQTCDTTKGCVEKKADIETSCANAEGGGMIVMASSGTFCMSNEFMSWHGAQEWCFSNGMTMPTMYEMCPSWDGNGGPGKCSELIGKFYKTVWSMTVSGANNVFCVEGGYGKVDDIFSQGDESLDPAIHPSVFAFCH